MHVKDLVVVQRQQRQSVRNQGGQHPQWTLHKNTCAYLRRVNESNLYPAPARPYPGTVECQACKPNGES